MNSSRSQYNHNKFSTEQFSSLKPHKTFACPSNILLASTAVLLSCLLSGRETRALAQSREIAPAPSPANRSQPSIQPAISGNFLFVNPAIGNDGGEGSQRSPLRTITRALQIAQSNTVILLAPGTYSAESGESFPLTFKPGITIQGEPSTRGRGIVIRGGGSFVSPTATQNATILGSNQATLTGVTVTNPNPHSYGLWIESSNIAVVSNTFNSTPEDGIATVGNSDSLIQNNVFTLDRTQDATPNPLASARRRVDLPESNASTRSIAIAIPVSPPASVSPQRSPIPLRVPTADAPIVIPVPPPASVASQPLPVPESQRQRQPMALAQPQPLASVAIVIPVPPPERGVSSLPQRTTNPALAANPARPTDILTVPNGDAPLGNLGDLPTISVSQNPLRRSSNATPVASRAAALGLRYRVVVVDADSESSQAQVRSLVPSAFRTYANGQVVMQVGAYNDRANADDIAQLLNSNGLRAIVQPME